MHSQAQAMLASTCPKKEPSPEKVKVSLSLDALLGGDSAANSPVVSPPPGLNAQTVKKSPTLKSVNKMSIKPPPGLDLPGLHGSDEETGTGSEGDTASTHSETEAPPAVGLVLSEVSSLTSKAPSFTPMLSPETVNMLMPDSTTTKPRTKLRSKANAYVPAAAFVPMAATAMAMAETLRRSAEVAAAQSYAAGFADAAAAAVSMIEANASSAGYDANYGENAGWDDSWEGYEGYDDGSNGYGDYNGWPATEQEW